MSPEEKFPSQQPLIRAARQRGWDDRRIERWMHKQGYKPEVQQTFLQALGENIFGSDSGTDKAGALSNIPLVGKPLEIAFEILDVPQDIATAAISSMFDENETFIEKFARGEDPSEALGIENPIAKFVTDVVLDPLNFIPGGGFIKGRKLAKGASRGKKIFMSLQDVEKRGATLRHLSENAAARGDLAAFEEIQKLRPDPDILHTTEAVIDIPTGNIRAQAAFNEEIVKSAQKHGLPIYDTKTAPLYVQYINMLKNTDVANDVRKGMKAQGLSDLDVDAVVLMTNKKALSSFASSMQQQSVVARRLNKLRKADPEIGDKIDNITDLTAKAGDEGWFRKLYNRIASLWKASIVSQLGTSSRNAIMQAARLGVDVVQQAIDSGIQRIMGLPKTAHPLDGLEAFSSMIAELKNPAKVLKKGLKPEVGGGFINDLLKKYPKEWDRVYGTFSSDIATGKLSKGMQQYADIINVVNRSQEFLIRRASIQAALKQALRKTGKNLDDIIRSGDVNAITKGDLEGAVSKALEMTFAAQPKAKLGKNFIKWMNEIPGAAFVMPFPRFLTNSLKFFYEFSPFGLMKLYSPKGSALEFAKILKGDTSTISRAILGSAMMGTAFQIRDSEYAGDKWYELKVGDKNVDMRPFNPFAAYLFVADITKRANEGRLHTLKAKDILQGVLSANMRGGTGLYVVDEVIKAFRGEGTGKKATDKIKSTLGEIAGGFLTPLNTIHDVYKEFNADARIVRDRRSEPFLGPIKTRIPGVAETLPELELSTREEPFKRVHPALKQLPGLIVQEERNLAEQELEKHGFTYREINPTTGDRTADQLISKFMGPLVESVVVPFVKSPGYKQMSNEMQAFQLSRILKRVRGAARKQAFAEDPNLFLKLKAKRKPIRERRFLESL